MVTGKVKRKWFISNPKINKHYNLLHDCDTINIGKTSIVAIETPGHTPGSMTYLLNDNILFSGDAFRLTEGKADLIRPLFTMDTERQKESIRKLAQLNDISLACTAHWGYTKDYRKTMIEWL